MGKYVYMFITSFCSMNVHKQFLMHEHKANIDLRTNSRCNLFKGVVLSESAIQKKQSETRMAIPLKT